MLNFTKCVLFTLTLAKGALLAVTLQSRVRTGHPGVKGSNQVVCQQAERKQKLVVIWGIATEKNMVSDIYRVTLYLSLKKTPESDLEGK